MYLFTSVSLYLVVHWFQAELYTASPPEIHALDDMIGFIEPLQRNCVFDANQFLLIDGLKLMVS